MGLGWTHHATGGALIVQIFGRSPAPGDPASAVDRLTPDAARRLHLSLFSRFNSRTLSEHVEQFPDLAFWVPGSAQYVVGGAWRRRDEVLEVVELARGQARTRLLDVLALAGAERGADLLLLDFDLHATDPPFFARAGFELIDRIIELERDGCRVDADSRACPDRTLSVEPYRLESKADLLAVDHSAFPWLWWNSSAELDAYARVPGVEMIVGRSGGRVVGYAGFTVRRADGHLDRLAVRSDTQGRGFGAGLLVAALQVMDRHGVRRVSLTTQFDNYRSQALYRRYGFRPGHWSYEIHGRWLRGCARQGTGSGVT